MYGRTPEMNADVNLRVYPSDSLTREIGLLKHRHSDIGSGTDSDIHSEDDTPATDAVAPTRLQPPSFRSTPKALDPKPFAERGKQCENAYPFWQRSEGKQRSLVLTGCRQGRDPPSRMTLL